MDKKRINRGNRFMNHNLARRFFICLAGGFFIISTLFTIGCAGRKIKVEYEKNDNSGYSEANHKYKHKKSGPPPHAPAHGYRAKHHYRYYPSYGYFNGVCIIFKSNAVKLFTE